MGVIRVERLWSGRSGSFGSDGVREYTSVYRVETDGVEDSELAVMFTAGVPLPGSVYVSSDGVTDEFATLRKISPRQDDGSGRLWLIDCDYSTAASATDPAGYAGSDGGGSSAGGGFQPGEGGAADDPTKEPPEWEIDWEDERKPFRLQLADPGGDNPTWTGKACMNSAYDFFDPLPERQTGYPVLVYSRTESMSVADMIARVRKYAYAMNKDVWNGLPPKHAQCLPIKVKRVFKGRAMYFRFTYRVRMVLISNGPPTPVGTRAPFPDAVPPDSGATWNPIVPDMGFREAINGKWVDIEDPPGTRVGEAQFLDGNGLRMSQADLRNLGPKVTELSAYRMVNFADLNIVL